MHRYCPGVGGEESLHDCWNRTHCGPCPIIGHLLGQDTGGTDRVAAQSMGSFVSRWVGWTLHLKSGREIVDRSWLKESLAVVGVVSLKEDKEDHLH